MSNTTSSCSSKSNPCASNATASDNISKYIVQETQKVDTNLQPNQELSTNLDKPAPPNTRVMNISCPATLSDFLSPASATRSGKPYNAKSKTNRFRPMTSHDLGSSPTLATPATSTPYNFPLPPELIAMIAPHQALLPSKLQHASVAGGKHVSTPKLSATKSTSKLLENATKNHNYATKGTYYCARNDFK